jgi:hypothetical protein
MKARIIGSLAPEGTRTTLMNLIFDGLPGVVGIGDTYSILNTPTHVQGEKVEEWFPFCNECGDKPCPLFTRELLEKLRTDQKHFYQRIAKAAGEPVLYTQDGPWTQYDLKGLPDVVLIYYRDIYAWSASEALWDIGGRRFTAELPDAEPLKDLEPVMRAVSKWIRFYREALAWLRMREIPFSTCNVDRFVDKPVTSLQKLCDWLSLPFDEQALRWYENEHHKIGGRYNASRGKRSRMGNTIKRDDAWKDFLTVRAMEHIRDRTDWRSLWNLLDTLNKVEIK